MATMIEEMTSTAGADHAQRPALAVQTSSHRVRHWQMLIVSVGVVFLAFMLQVVPPDRVAFRLAPQWVLPETCGSKLMFGVSCPGCGLTRCFVYLAAGDFSKAFQMNRVGFIMAIAVLLQLPYRLLALQNSRWTPSVRCRRWFGNGLIALLVANWLWMLFE